MDTELRKIIDILKKGSLPQRVSQSTKWIDDEIKRLKVELARKPQQRINAAFYRSKKIYPLEILKDLLNDLRAALLRQFLEPEGLDRQISCVKREIALRKAVYSKRVKAGKMKAEEARREYDTMMDVLQTLEEIKNGPKAGAF